MSYDITWCAKMDCTNTKCFRNPIHLPNNDNNMYSFCYFEGTSDCPMKEEDIIDDTKDENHKE